MLCGVTVNKGKKKITCDVAEKRKKKTNPAARERLHHQILVFARSVPHRLVTQKRPVI